MAYKTHLYSKKKCQEMSLRPMRPRLSIEAVVGGKSMATEALKPNPRRLGTHKQSNDWYYTTKQFFLLT